MQHTALTIAPANRGTHMTATEAPPTAATAEPALGRVLAGMMAETVALMDEVSALGEQRAATAAPNPHEIGATLRAANRLARIGAWILATEEADATDRRSDPRPARTAATPTTPSPETAADDAPTPVDWAQTLSAARTGALDTPARIGPLAEIQIRIDRLTDRACRLDALLRGDGLDAPGAPPATEDRPSAVILTFPGPRQAAPVDLNV